MNTHKHARLRFLGRLEMLGGVVINNQSRKQARRIYGPNYGVQKDGHGLPKLSGCPSTLIVQGAARGA